jgi:hypothetical protein
MSHLSIERLAALADEQPTADEHAHIRACPACAQEIEAHRSLLAMAGSERDTLGIPLTRWESLAQRLRTEGLIAYPGEQSGSVTAEWAAAPVGRNLSRKSWMRFAAAIVLVASGAIAGRASTGAAILPGGITGAEPAQTARGSIPDSVPTAFASVEQANQWKQYHVDGYQRAVSFLAAQDSATRPAETPAAMMTRLAALDRVSRTMREALQEAPFDPIINDFYLNSFGQREATLRQLNTVLPQNVRLNSY